MPQGKQVILDAGRSRRWTAAGRFGKLAIAAEQGGARAGHALEVTAEMIGIGIAPQSAHLRHRQQTVAEIAPRPVDALVAKPVDGREAEPPLEYPVELRSADPGEAKARTTSPISTCGWCRAIVMSRRSFVAAIPARGRSSSPTIRRVAVMDVARQEYGAMGSDIVVGVSEPEPTAQ
ncbi:MAG: hypothetical protein P4M09_28750 [Devosia sp.]|nr:hypothetical protein [Devosia sp.]